MDQVELHLRGTEIITVKIVLGGSAAAQMFTLTNLILSGILLLNSVAILNEERFLTRSNSSGG